MTIEKESGKRDTTERGLSRRDFGRITIAGAAALPLAGLSSIEAARETATAAHIQAQATAGDPPKPDLKPHAALTPDQAAKLDESLTKLAGQLAQMRKHPLPYIAEPAFTFHAELPHRAPPALPTQGTKG